MDTTTRAQLEGLLASCCLSEQDMDLRTLTQLFLTQMRISLYGGKSSIPMLPTFLKPFGELPDGQPVAVAEIDDQEVRVSLVTFQNGKPTITEQDSFPVPGRDYPAPLEDLLFAAAELLEPMLDRAKDVALCLPFPMDYDSKGDACIRRFPGTMDISDYEGRPILAILKEEFSQRGFPDLNLVAVPQPGAIQLAAAVEKPGQSRYQGMVWGTHIAGGFAAPGSMIVRWLAIPSHLMLMDCGFSSFEQIPFGMADLPKDRDCYAPGLDLLLKAVSTDYIGDTYRLVMLKAAERKLLSFGCSRDFLSLTTMDLASVIEFLNDPIEGGTIAHFCREPQDREIGLFLANAVLDRPVRLVCAMISAMASFAGIGRDPEAPACLGAFGEALEIPPLKDRLENLMQSFTRDVLGHHITLCTGKDMLAVGSAAAALYNR
ncbi:MAG: hypothetical protein IJO69_04540 [Ruminiclostridium sp.]|nr:hypothetical protein [Ruminiclostridium sp.]MBQ9933084.1 hypothetical protein [Ruminiclostridium sp.]